MNHFEWKENRDIDAVTVERLAEELAIPVAGARFLVSRSLTDTEEVRRYLDPAPDQTHDPFLFEHMRAAVDLVASAARNGKKVLIHGDYDVDGISGTALLYQYLDGVFGTVFRFVPDRRKDGYGIAARAVDWAITERVGLFIAVDCGTSDVEMIERLEREGIDVIVCDHHEFPPDGRTAGTMLNPSRPGERYPFKSLCGTGVAYKLVEALDSEGVRGRTKPGSLVDLMALATVGDLSPLVGENRYYVKAGLDAMTKSPRVGLAAIKGNTRIGSRAITAAHVSFVFAPRLNAPGRVSRPKPSLEILCEKNKDRALQLASILEGENERRRELTEMVRDAAVSKINDLSDRDARAGFVLAGEGWDEGVLGIAAARVVEEFGRPAILMSVKDGLAKGSGRSTPGVNLKKHVDRFHDQFVRYGGHAQAIGLTMEAAKISAFAQGLSENLKEDVPLGVPRSLSIDASIDLEECSTDLLDFFSRCEPFGFGNREPVWKLSDLQVSRSTTIVGDGHLKLFFQDARGNPGEAIAFGWDRDETPDDLHDRVVDIAVRIKRGFYLNRVYPELRLVDIRFHRG